MTRWACVLFSIALLALSASIASAQTPLRDVIDNRVQAKWQEENLAPAPPADDATFLRRVYLDLCGTIPTADEAREFLDDQDPQKRAKLIDRLLDDPRYAQHQADVWDMIYFGRNPPGYKTNERSGFQKWLRKQFAENTPYDAIARAILKAEGNSVDDGAPMFFVQYKNKPEDATEKITQTFLGIQLQCARCHDHPFEPWTQLDFYGTAAFFARLDVVDVGKKNNETAWAIGEQDVGEINFTGPVTEDEPGKEGTPVPPKFLYGDELDEAETPEDAKEERFKNGKMPPKPQFSRKDAFAEWATAEDNPYFARAVANRVWAQFMGRGLVHPVDDMSEANQPSHPELLEQITRQLVDHDFDLKWYIRELVNSQTYQLSSLGDSTVQERPRYFERARTRPLTAEELADCWRVATRYAAADDKLQERLDQGNRFYPLTSGYHLSAFGTPTDGTGNFLGGMHEQLYMSNGGISKLFRSNEGGLLHTLAEAKKDTPWEDRVELMYLSILSRRPSPAESQKFVEFFQSADQDRPHETVKDAMWVLMTCSEFRFNH